MQRLLTYSSYGSMFLLGLGLAVVGAAAKNIGLDPSEVGLLLSAQHAGFVLSVAVTAALVDTSDKTLLLGIGALLLGIGLLMFFATPSFPVNLAAMFGLGLGMGVFETATDTLLVDLHPGGHSRPIAINHFAVTLGCVGITAYLILAAMQWRASIIAAGICALALAGVFFTTARKGRCKPQAGQPFFARLRGIENRKTLGMLALVAGACICLELGTLGFLTSYLVDAGGFSPDDAKIGLVVFLSGIATGRLAAGLFVRDQSLKIWLSGLLLFSSLSAFGLYGSSGGMWLYGIVFGCGLFTSALFPLIIALSARLAPASPGFVIGLMKLVIPLGGMLIAAGVTAGTELLNFGTALYLIPIAGMGGFGLLLFIRVPDGE